jgi:hypothetical protein
MDRWATVKRIHQAALDHDGDRRAAFLDGACAGDAALRRDVESLLAYEDRAKSFLEVPEDRLNDVTPLPHRHSNYKPDCDLMNPAAHDNRASGGDFCSQWLQPNFGSVTSVNTVNPAILDTAEAAEALGA